MTTQPKSTRPWLKLVIAFVNFNLTVSIQFIKFQRHSTTSIRLLDHYKAIDNVPLMRCFLHCYNDQNCISINYKTATETCEMNDKSSKYGVVDLVTEQNWDVYSIDKGRCSKGWLNFLGSCYWFEKEHKENWTTALSSCAALNAHLLKIESDSENILIKAEIPLQIQSPNPEEIRVWMAGNDLDKENEWVWAEMNGDVLELASGGIIDFTDWAPDRPDNWDGQQHCLTIYAKRNYMWDDGTCSSRLFYVCKV